MGTNQYGIVRFASLVMAAFLLLPFATLAQKAGRVEKVIRNLVEIAPPSSEEVVRYTRNPVNEPHLTDAAKLALLRKKIKYVFVLFQENRSFDFYFGTYPGAHGLFSQASSQLPALFSLWSIPMERSSASLHS